MRSALARVPIFGEPGFSSQRTFESANTNAAARSQQARVLIQPDFHPEARHQYECDDAHVPPRLARFGSRFRFAEITA